jgi:chaperonin GroES
MQIEPLRDRIVVKRIQEEEVTKGGIIIPEQAKEKPSRAVVISVGEGRLLDDGRVVPLAVSVGDEILFSKWAGSEVMVNEEELLILREDDVIGIVREPLNQLEGAPTPKVAEAPEMGRYESDV